MTLRRYLFEWLAAIIWIHSFRLLPFATASAVGGLIGRQIGPHLAVSKVARRNLQIAYPHKGRTELNAIILKMWDNLGRSLGEFPHLPIISNADIAKIVCEQIGTEHLEFLASQSTAGIIVSGHFGNWELAPLMANYYGLPLALIFRPANNPYTNKIIIDVRDSYARTHMAKGRGEVRAIIETLRNQQTLGALLDQKMRDGIEVNFLGQPTLAAPAMASLARQFNCPVVMARVKRLGSSARFRLEVLPPLTYDITDNKAADIARFTQLIYDIYAEWVHDAPEQWFWVHKRWDKARYE